MSFYQPKINDRFQNPRNTGRVAAANAIGTNATFICGAVLRFTLRIDKQAIAAAKYQTNGCGYLIASADILVDKIVGKQLAELHGLDHQVLREEIEIELGAFGEHRRHCLELSLDTLQAAFNDFRFAQLEEWRGEKALICTCFGISEETIERITHERHLETVEEVTNICRAGGGCGSCRFLIQEIIDSSSQNF